MKKPTAVGTPVYQRQHSRGLTLPQLNAVDLLAAGKTDKETAELLSLSRVCVTKWRLYDPAFQAALNVRRAEIWSVGAARLRALIPKALDVLAGELEKPDGPNRVKAAVALLRLVPLTDSAPAGPTEPDEIVRRIVMERRAQTRGPLDDLIEDGKGLPPLDRHIRETWSELEARSQESEPTSRNSTGDGKVDSIG
jgi:hypothetical protein